MYDRYSSDAEPVFSGFVQLAYIERTSMSQYGLMGNNIRKCYLVTLCKSPCRIRSDRQTTSLTLTTGVCEAGTKMRGASNMNIHCDVTGLLTAAWRSHSGQIVWAA